MKTVTFSHPYGEKGLQTVWFITVVICRPAGKALLLALSQPCHFRHELLTNTPWKWQPWHPELLRVRERSGARADRPCLVDPERGRGMQGRSRARIFWQSNPMPALHRASAAASRSLCWDGERVPPCAQQQPWLHPEHGGPCPSPAASCALQRGQQPREIGGVGARLRRAGLPGRKGFRAEPEWQSQSGRASGRRAVG